MEVNRLCFLIFVICPVALMAWPFQEENRNAAGRRGRHVHYHSKRNDHSMLNDEPGIKRGSVTKPPPRSREMRKKPSGQLTPIEDEEMVNDEVVSVAINPPLARPKLDRPSTRKYQKEQTGGTSANVAAATSLLKEVFVQLGQDFMMREANENFVFGQYIGNAMKNLSSELRIRMQHDILDLVQKYQRLHLLGSKPLSTASPDKEEKTEFNTTASDANSYANTIGLTNPNMFASRNPPVALSNDTEDPWGDFSLAKLVGKKKMKMLCDKWAMKYPTKSNENVFQSLFEKILKILICKQFNNVSME